MRATRAVALILLSLLPRLALAAEGARPDAQGPRLALIIGNGGYTDAPLTQPVSDARAVAAALQKLGFQVSKRENVTQKELYEALQSFGDRLRRGGTGLFYFSGYAIQLKTKNYLLPVDASVRNEEDIARLAVDLDHVLETVTGARNRLNIIIVDAAREYPPARKIKSAGIGLAPMKAPAGSIIAFAAAPNSASTPGKGQGSLYTQNLVALMSEPGLRLEELFHNVRVSVDKQTGGKQVPWVDLSLTGEFYFSPPKEAARAAGRPGVPNKAEVDRLSKKASSGDAASLQELKNLAAAGSLLAQTSLGNMYLAGLGVTQDYAEAAKWYRSAAEQGDAVAQNLLAFMYENGQGVPKSREEAVRWYRKAAEQGIADARRALARLGQ